MPNVRRAALRAWMAGTYPFAANTDGTAFRAQRGTPTVNGLYAKITPNGPVGPLLTNNPNSFNPTRLSHSQALTCDQNHGYTAEQKAVNSGKMDQFVQNTETATCSAPNFGKPGLVMDYYDGNTVTGLWNYAQHYAMSDNNWDTTFGPSTPGALNLISGQTGAAFAVDPTTGAKVPSPSSVSPLNGGGLGTIFGDLDPAYDDCSDGSHATTSPLGVATGKNVGDLLNARGLSWGWFQGGFAPTGTTSAGLAVCGAKSTNIGGVSVADYSPHHEPFQYYKSTANPKHLPPSSEAAVGRTDQANHQYDLSWFYKTLTAGNMPAVSFLKASEYQDGHPGYSDPLDEQNFLVNTINQVERSKFWKSTAIVVTYDDSDGWYDHQPPVIVNGSNTSAGRRDLHLGADDAGQLPRPVRLQPAAAAAGDLALDPGEPRQRQGDQHLLDHPLHRGQLARRDSGSAAAPSTRARAASPGEAACSASSRPTSGRSSSSRPPARWSRADRHIRADVPLRHIGPFGGTAGAWVAWVHVDDEPAERRAGHPGARRRARPRDPPAHHRTRHGQER